MESNNLERFVMAQEHVYAGVLDELRSGQKRSHWIWFIFPQLRGLGKSEESHFYGIQDEAEALEYFHHPELGPRYLECLNLVHRHIVRRGKPAKELMGNDIDVLKLRSSLELFSRVAPPNSLVRTFAQAILAKN